MFLGGDQREMTRTDRKKMEQMRGSPNLGFVQKCTHHGQARSTLQHNNKSLLSNKLLKSTY